MWEDSTAALILLILCTPVCLHVAYTDLRSMEIENYDSLALLGIFVLVSPFLVSWDVWMIRLAWILPVLIVGFILSVLNLLGAGDAKLIAAMTPFAAGPEVSGLVLIIAFLILVMIPLHRLFRAFPVLRPGVAGWASWDDPGFPMGVVLGPSLLVFLAILTI